MADEPVSADGNSRNANEDDLYDHPGGGKAKSKVWDVFAFKKIDKALPPLRRNLDMTTAVCRLCRKAYKNTGNTTNFMSHIRSEHTLPAASNSKQKSTTTCNTGHGSAAAATCTFKTLNKFARPIGQVQTTLNFQTSTNKLGSDRKGDLDDSLMKLLVGKVLPTSLVENDYFKDFVHKLEPRYKLPSRKTLMSWLEKKKESIEECVKGDIRTSAGVAITHDGWTSNATESFHTTTIHYIDNNWRLNSAVLGTVKMEGSHTSENIAQSLQKTKMTWSLPDNIIATTDNAANEQKAFKLLDWPRFGCFGHKLNLVVKNSLQSNEINRITSKGRRLVTLFHSSTSAHDLLMEKQKQLDIKGAGHKLINDVPTRWNSTLSMLERLLEQMPALMAIAVDENVSKTIRTTLQNTIFSFEETSTADKVVSLLTPFLRATEIVCSEMNPTISKIIPILTKLKRQLEVSEDDPPLIQSMKRKMYQQLIARSEGEDRNLALLGCILNPNTKGFEFCLEKKLEAEEILKSYLSTITTRVSVKMEPSDDDTNQNQPLTATGSNLPSLPTMDDPKENSDTVPDHISSQQNVESPNKNQSTESTEDTNEIDLFSNLFFMHCIAFMLK